MSLVKSLGIAIARVRTPATVTLLSHLINNNQLQVRINWWGCLCTRWVLDVITNVIALVTDTTELVLTRVRLVTQITSLLVHTIRAQVSC